MHNLKWFSILLGIILLIWFPMESNQLASALLLAVYLASLLTLFLFFKLRLLNRVQQKRPVLTTILGGLLAGCFVTPCALTLMAIKTGWHNHSVPEYSSLQVMSVLNLTPVWIVAGLLASLGWELYKKFN